REESAEGALEHTGRFGEGKGECRLLLFAGLPSRCRCRSGVREQRLFGHGARRRVRRMEKPRSENREMSRVVSYKLSFRSSCGRERVDAVWNPLAGARSHAAVFENTPSCCCG